MVFHITYPEKGERGMDSIQRPEYIVTIHYSSHEIILSKIRRNATEREQISMKMPMFPSLLVKGYTWKLFMGKKFTMSEVSSVNHQ